LLAREGLLFDAAPLFEDADNVRDVGVLLAIPILVQQGLFFEMLRIYPDFGPAFYGVRNTTVCLCLMMMLNLCRLQDILKRTPHDMGRLMGLDRSPELKTLRRKLCCMVRQKKASLLMDALAKRQLRSTEGKVWLYLDGHVAIYTGEKKLRPHHVTQLRVARPSMNDYWVNLPDGVPVLVVTGPENEGLVRRIKELVPWLKTAAPGHHHYVIFDREGWSPELFAWLKQQGVDFLTYRKAKSGKKLPRIALNKFQLCEGEVNGRKVSYHLADTHVRIGYKHNNTKHTIRLRQITRRRADGRQTHVLTSDEKSPALELAHRMFGRWGQENFFKKGAKNFGIDALVSHEVEPEDGDRLVVNPKRKKLERQLKEKERKLSKEHQELGKREVEGQKLNKERHVRYIKALEAEIEGLKQRRQALPTKVAVGQTKEGAELVKPRVEYRRLMHVFRIAGYRAETGLLELLRPHFNDWEHEGRQVVRGILRSSGNLRVTPGQLTVEVSPQASPYKTRALQALCEELTGMGAAFPGTNLKMVFTIAPSRIERSSAASRS
jgi:hypothetical protein